MFLTSAAQLSSTPPSNSTIALNDWRILARYWYPVAVAGDVRDTPAAARLLDVDLVVYRSRDAVAVALDRCPHRHIRLSAGSIVDGCLVCAYHGLSFDAAGACTRVPALGPRVRPPPAYKLVSFRSEIRYGLVWVCLDHDSPEQVPDLPAALGAGDDHLRYALVRDWPVSAPRQIENFIDLAHIPFVHANSMGGDPGVATPRGRVVHDPRGLLLTDIVRERRLHSGDVARVDMHYLIVLPFLVDMHSFDLSTGKRRIQMYNIATPVSAQLSRVFQFFVTDEPWSSKESRPAVDDGDQIVLEDIALLQAQHEHALLLSGRGEIHLPQDHAALAYRKLLMALGLGQPHATPPAEPCG